MTNETEAVRAVERHEPVNDYDSTMRPCPGMKISESGGWVSYTDHTALIDRLTDGVHALEDRCTMLSASANVESRRADAGERACRAALAYDEAIRACANSPAKMASFCTAQGETLDSLYDEWITASKAALTQPEADHG